MTNCCVKPLSCLWHQSVWNWFCIGSQTTITQTTSQSTSSTWVLSFTSLGDLDFQVNTKYIFNKNRKKTLESSSLNPVQFSYLWTRWDGVENGMKVTWRNKWWALYSTRTNHHWSSFWWLVAPDDPPKIQSILNFPQTFLFTSFWNLSRPQQMFFLPFNFPLLHWVQHSEQPVS